MGQKQSKLGKQRQPVQQQSELVQPIGRAIQTIDADTITAESLQDDGRTFKVRLLSSNACAQGASAALLKGRLLGGYERPVMVALKVFHEPVDPGARNLYYGAYLKELQVARLLGASKSYVLPYLGICEMQGRPVIISRFMCNGNLLDYFATTVVDRQTFILQIAKGVEFLHRIAGIVHGDIKCENVVISDEGRPLLADFGLSALIHKSASLGITDTNLRACNTVRFAAPELLSDSAESGIIRSKTTSSDVFAFGMLMVQAFTGEHPWPGVSREVVAHKVLSGQVHPRPGGLATDRGFNDRWWFVCVKCWAFEPEKRPDMRDVRSALKRTHGTIPIPLKPHIWRIISSYISPVAYSEDDASPDLTRSQAIALQFLATQLMPSYAVSQKDKLSLALVSKGLLASVLPELCYHVRIGTLNQLNCLSRALELHPIRRMWIHRLDLDCDAPDVADKQRILILPLILQPCAVLSIHLTHRGTYINLGDHASYWPSLLYETIPALARRTITHYGAYARVRDPLEIVAGAYHGLEGLELDMSLLDVWHDLDTIEAPAVTLPRLHTLELTLSTHPACHSMLGLMEHWRLQGLKNLRLLGTFSPVQELHGFIISHGAHVELLELGSVELPAHGFSSPAPPWVFDSNTLPRLLRLVVTASRGLSMPHTLLPAHTGVTVIGIRKIESKVRNVDVPGILAELGDCMPNAGRFPSLREIRSLTYGESTTTRMLQDAQLPVLQLFWRRLVELARRNGDVRVCDPWGKVVILPTGVKDRACGTPSDSVGILLAMGDDLGDSYGVPGRKVTGLDMPHLIGEIE